MATECSRRKKPKRGSTYGQRIPVAVPRACPAILEDLASAAIKVELSVTLHFGFCGTLARAGKKVEGLRKRWMPQDCLPAGTWRGLKEFQGKLGVGELVGCFASISKPLANREKHYERPAASEKETPLPSPPFWLVSCRSSNH